MLIMSLDDLLPRSFFKIKYNITANDDDIEHDRKNSVARMVKDGMIRKVK